MTGPVLLKPEPRLIHLRLPRYWGVTAVFAVLPISYVPLEISRVFINLALLHFALIVALGIRYRIDRGFPIVPLEVVMVAYAFWEALRLLVLAPLQDEGFPVSTAIGELLPWVAGFIAFRLARIPELRRAIIRGLTIGLGIMLAFEAYQYTAGTGRLQGLGYLTPTWNYYTESAEFRPFSTFYSPTVFAIYLVVVVLALLFLTEGWIRWAVAVAGVAGVALTYTRAAWIGFAVGLLACLPFVPGRVWRRSAIYLIFAALGVTWWLVADPTALSSFVDRLDTIGSSDYTSNSDRRYLWNAVWTLIPRSPIIGFGAQPFADNANTLIGSIAQLGHAHSNYLEQLYLYGFPGMGLFMLLLVTMLYTVLRSDGLHRVAGIAFVVAFAVDSLLETTWGAFNINETLFLLVGLCAAPLLPRPDPIGWQHNAASAGRWGRWDRSTGSAL